MQKLYLKSGLGEKKEKERKTKWFLENGSILLKELIADSNGKSIPIRSFSSYQILKATNNFESSCFISQDAYYKWYKGRIEDRSYMIKKFTEDRVTGNRVEEVYNDIVLSARMSNHNNFLKLLGCCLEFPFPVLLFEYAEYGVLNRKGGIMVSGEESVLPWNIRLKIGAEIANALSYLHMAFPEIIIHRDVKPMHVFLDKKWAAKLSDLSFSISLPEGKSRIEAERVIGTTGYLDPLYFATNYVTEYTDVYSFGAFLLVVLTGKPVVFTESNGNPQNVIGYVKGLYENGKIDEVIYPKMVRDKNRSDQRLQLEACVVLALRCCNMKDEDRPKMMKDENGSDQRLQLEACVELALRCCVMKDEDRPKMMEIAKELKRIERSSRS